MEIYQAIILGIVQGLTELLPVSSSAHLTIIPWIFNWNIPESFDVALHFGTLLAIGLFFFKDWISLIKGGYNYVVKKEKTVQGRMFWYIVLATIPGGIVGFLLDHFLSDVLNKPLIIALALIVMGIIIYIADSVIGVFSRISIFYAITSFCIIRIFSTEVSIKMVHFLADCCCGGIVFCQFIFMIMISFSFNNNRPDQRISSF